MKNKFAEKLKELRKEMALTQKELADKLGFERTTVSGWEQERKEPNYDTLIMLAKFFNVTVDYLLGLED